jgi:serine/threonine protein phosphatase PrpC
METSVEDRKTTVAGRDVVGRDTSDNEDAARRRMLDNRARGKSASSVSSISSESSILTDDPYAESAIESEITETEDDGDDASCVRESNRKIRSRKVAPTSTPPFQQCLINTPGGCNCHSYRAHEAMLYTAHVGDCRAVLLGSSPPRTIKVRPASGGPSLDHPDTTDDESSYHSSDETECLSSSDHDAESSDEEGPSIQAAPYMSFVRRAACRQRAKRRDMGSHAPFFALPPLRRDAISSEEESEAEIEPSPSTKLYPSRVVRTGSDSEDDNASNETLLSETHEMSPPLHLAPCTRPIDLTTDHSAYNPVEVALVRRRCNNAPRAISSGIGGGIKRVAGSLAVTRALGDAYLKTPSLSFDPYRRNCPYITARPETSCRLLSREGDSVLILASDGVWERCKGEDILRWIRNYSAERIADAERKNSRRRGTDPDRVSQDSVSNERSGTESVHDKNESDATLGHKRELQASPLPIHVAKKQKKRKVIPLPVRESPRSSGLASVSTVADVIVRRVLNKVRKARNMTSLQALMTLPKGRARRSKHDDITASVVALSAFVSPPSTAPQKG